MFDYLRPHGQPTRLSVPGGFPGKTTGTGSRFLLHGIFLTRDWTRVSHIEGRFFTIWATRDFPKTQVFPEEGTKSPLVHRKLAKTAQDFPWGIIGETVHKSPMNCNYKWVGCGKQLVWLSGEVLPALHSLKQSLSICCTFSFLRNYFSKLVQQGWENTFVNGSCGWHCELRVCQDLWKFSDKNQRYVTTA